MKKTTKTTATKAVKAEAAALEAAVVVQVENKPEAQAAPQSEAEALVKKARAARQAADLGLLDKAVAEALEEEARAACKPNPEKVALADEAKKVAAEAAKKAKAAQAAADLGLLDNTVAEAAKADADAKQAAYKEAAKAAKGFSFGAGTGGPRFKGRMSGIDAALTVLARSEKPLKLKEIFDTIIDEGLWAPEGATPDRTLSAALQRELKKGAESRFLKTDKGLFAARQPEATSK